VRGIIHRHWIKLGMRAFAIYLNQEERSRKLVQAGYNEVASFYDSYWTEDMSHLSENMLKRVDPPKEGKCLDLTCGTGFVTQKLSEITSGDVTGIDASEEMIAVAQKKYGDTCRFLHSDAYHFLEKQPSHSYDCITCAWGLGYLPPRVLYEIFRTLRHHGKIGIIDNSMLSNWEFVLFFLVALAEEPTALNSIIKPQFFFSAGTLTQRMRMNRFTIIDSWKGEKILRVGNRDAVMEQLIKSGVAAGILQIIDEDKKDSIIKRTGELLQKHYSSKEYIPITHRYIGAVGEKK
jgi:ubiquinone/menaquinone biosynthesis C-methylase UbiE